MRVQVRYFASAREATGLEQEELGLEPGATVAGALAALEARHPALVPLRPNLRFAVDTAFVEPGDRLADGATLALIPPVGGG